ncbi:MAG TPA: CHRD domain-containing protein [Gemmatimonadaceae bacterium]|nr:CHRD domain-containing protein [Gemmatimonadaceae bacterium]
MNFKRGLLAVIASGAVFGACDNGKFVEVPGKVNDEFTTALAGANEKPNAVTTTAAGTTNLTIVDTNTIRVQTLVSAIDSVTVAHIHAGDPSIAGPIMVFLVGPFSATQLVARGPGGTSTLNGVLSHVDIVRGITNFSGLFTFDSLMTRIKAGTAYANVHTRKNPGGEIRGQLLPK